jgi:hypothetical protein
MSARDEVNAAAKRAGWEINAYDNGDFSYEMERTEIVVRYSKSGNVTKGMCRIGCTLAGELAEDKKSTLLSWIG